MGSSNKNSQKFIFLFTVIIVAVLRYRICRLSASPADSQTHRVRDGRNQSAAYYFGAARWEHGIIIGIALKAALVSLDAAGSEVERTIMLRRQRSRYFGEVDTSASVFSRTAQTAVPSFSKEAILVSDITNSVDLAAVNIDVRWPTASLTKLMTATVVLDHLVSTRASRSRRKCLRSILPAKHARSERNVYRERSFACDAYAVEQRCRGGARGLLRSMHNLSRR